MKRKLILFVSMIYFNRATKLLFHLVENQSLQGVLCMKKHQIDAILCAFQWFWYKDVKNIKKHLKNINLMLFQTKNTLQMHFQLNYQTYNWGSAYMGCLVRVDTCYTEGLSFSLIWQALHLRLAMLWVAWAYTRKHLLIDFKLDLHICNPECFADCFLLYNCLIYLVICS